VLHKKAAQRSQAVSSLETYTVKMELTSGLIVLLVLFLNLGFVTSDDNNHVVIWNCFLPGEICMS